jgi:hypothetical protein
MTQRDLLGLLVLAQIADDYEEMDHIYEMVCERANRCGIVARMDDIGALLIELVASGLAGAYRLSTKSPPIEIMPPLRPEDLKEYYFWVTPKGVELFQSSRDQLPFDEEDELVPGWSIPTVD